MAQAQHAPRKLASIGDKPLRVNYSQRGDGRQSEYRPRQVRTHTGMRLRSKELGHSGMQPPTATRRRAWSRRCLVLARRAVVVLAAAGENVLRGNGEFKLGKSNSVALMVVLPDRDPQRAQFTIKRASSKTKKPGSDSSQQQQQQHQHHQ